VSSEYQIAVNLLTYRGANKFSMFIFQSFFVQLEGLDMLHRLNII